MEQSRGRRKKKKKKNEEEIITEGFMIVLSTSGTGDELSACKQ